MTAREDDGVLSEKDFLEFKRLRSLMCDLSRISKGNMSLARKLLIRAAIDVIEKHSDQIRGGRS